MLKVIQNYMDGEAERIGDALTDTQSRLDFESWSFPYAFLRHNGWSDGGCDDWPLTRGIWNSYNHHKGDTLLEFDIGIEPTNWTIGPSYFHDKQVSMEIRQVLFNLGPLSLSITLSKVSKPAFRVPR